jgi:hypothetical protein
MLVTSGIMPVFSLEITRRISDALWGFAPATGLVIAWGIQELPATKLKIHHNASPFPR